MSISSVVEVRKRVLLLTHRLPYPPDRGDRIRSYHLLKALSQEFEVSLASVSEEPVWLQHHHILRGMAKRVALQPILKPWSAVRAGVAFLGGKPITPAWHFRLGLAEQIRQWHQEAPFDAVVTFCTGMIEYARILFPAFSPGGAGIDAVSVAGGGGVAGDTTVMEGGGEGHGGSGGGGEVSGGIGGGVKRPYHILDLVDVDSLKWDSYAKGASFPMSWVYGAEARRLRRIESGKLDHFDAVTVISSAEARAYRKYVGEHGGLTVVRNGVDLEYFTPQPDPGPGDHTLVFVGVLNYKPNSDSIIWFSREVMPLLRQKFGDAHLLVVGRHPTPGVEELSHIPGVEVVGSVPDVRTYIAKASVVIAPLLMARGTQNKVLEAMACQRLCVCSTGAAAGIDAVADEHLLVAGDVGQWVSQISFAWSEYHRRQVMAEAARRHVQANYSWSAAISPMLELLRGVKKA